MHYLCNSHNVQKIEKKEMYFNLIDVMLRKLHVGNIMCLTFV